MTDCLTDFVHIWDGLTGSLQEVHSCSDLACTCWPLLRKRQKWLDAVDIESLNSSRAISE